MRKKGPCLKFHLLVGFAEDKRCTLLRYLKALWRGKQKAIFTRHSLVKALQAIMMPVNAIYSKHCLDKKIHGKQKSAISFSSLSQIQAVMAPDRRKGSGGKKLSLSQQQGWDSSSWDRAARLSAAGMGSCEAQGPGGDSVPQWKGWMCSQETFAAVRGRI